MFNLKILTEVELNKLTNEELMRYKKDVWEHGMKVQDYISEVETLWLSVVKLLQERCQDIEYQLACLQRDGEDRLYGSGDSYPEDVIN